MEKNQQQTSFIPKKESGSDRSLKRVKAPMTIYSWVATAVFIVAVLLSAGGFFYERYLNSQNDQKKAVIQEELSAFDPELTNTLSVLKSRIDSGKDILDNHLSVSTFLSYLESITANNIFFNDFAFEVASAGGSRNIEITADGIAPSYAAVAFQSDTFRSADFIKSVSFSELNLNEEGDIAFSFEAALDPEVVLYKESVATSTAIFESEEDAEADLEEEESEGNEDGEEENEGESQGGDEDQEDDN